MLTKSINLDIINLLIWTSSFLEKVFVLQKICFKVKVLKTFKISTDYHIKHADLSNKGLFWKKLSFRRSCTFSVGFKKKPPKKMFSSVKTKTNSNFAGKLAKRSNHSVLLTI